jgi:hypothetical protein
MERAKLLQCLDVVVTKLVSEDSLQAFGRRTMARIPSVVIPTKSMEALRHEQTAVECKV